jgi:hypothetical protein
MATVRVSKELIDRIVRAASNRMQHAVDRAKAKTLDNSWGQRIYDTLFFEDKPIISRVPARWLKMVNKIEIRGVGSQICNMSFTFATPQPWPNQFSDTKLAYKEMSYLDPISLKDSLEWKEFHDEVLAYNERVFAASERRTEFVGMVNQVISAYSTLAPALKAWPPLWDLIPEDVKDKHREITERTKNEVVLDVDIGKLTALSAAAKFGL